MSEGDFTAHLFVTVWMISCDSVIAPTSQSATDEHPNVSFCHLSVFFVFLIHQKVSASTLTFNQLRFWRKLLKAGFFYSLNVEEAQSLHWVVWVRIKVKSLFLKHSWADITVTCARRLLVCFSSVCQTEMLYLSSNDFFFLFLCWTCLLSLFFTSVMTPTRVLISHAFKRD